MSDNFEFPNPDAVPTIVTADELADESLVNPTIDPRVSKVFDMFANLPSRTENLMTDLAKLPEGVSPGFLGVEFARGEDGHLALGTDDVPLTWADIRNRRTQHLQGVKNQNPFTS
jgi:hypothetical protein